MHYDVVVVGGGLYGLITAYYLSKMSSKRVAIIEQYTIGNFLGSSHGASRISRSTYVSDVYRSLVTRVHEKELPELEQDLGVQILYKNSGLFFGKGQLFDAYQQNMLQSGLDIELLDALQAKDLFPQFTFDSDLSILHDKTGGVLAAHVMIQALHKKLLASGVIVLEQTKVLTIDQSLQKIVLITDKQKIVADKVVVTAGKYVQEVLPQLQQEVSIVEQTVMYAKLEGITSQYKLGSFPQFSSISDEINEIYYGMPELFSDGVIKLSQHITHKTPSNQLANQKDIDDVRIQKLLAFIDHTFVDKLEKILSIEHCFYTNTKDEHFIVGALPGDNRIIVGSVCSGHGFKFAPIIGKVLAELTVNQCSTIREYEDNKALFVNKLR